MIILHSEYSEESREFVRKYGEGNTVLTYPECLNYYKTISAFPSVVVEVPAYNFPDTTIGALDVYQCDSTSCEWYFCTQDLCGCNPFCEDSTCYKCAEAKLVNVEPEYVIPSHNVEGYTEIMRAPQTWTEVENYVNFVNKRAVDNPYI
jgi:hypothetical protein